MRACRSDKTFQGAGKMDIIIEGKEHKHVFE